MKFVTEHITKILGTAQTLVAAILGAVATGQIPDLIAQDSRGMQILILLNILIGAATTGVGFNNTAKVKVAEAMQTAIKATPPLVAALFAVLLLTGCATNDGLTNGGKAALREVAAIGVARYVREQADPAKVQKIRETLAELQSLPDSDFTTVGQLRSRVQARIDSNVSDPYDRQDLSRLLGVVAPLLTDYVGAGELAPDAVVRVRDFIGYLSAALPPA